MAVFVLVPGAFLGAWAWEDTARALEEQGHTVLPLTLTGLAERADLATAETGLETHIGDIVDAVTERGLEQVVLVAHSYGAAPVTGAAGRLGDRLRAVVYVDSAPFAEGMRGLDLIPPEETERMRKEVAEQGGGRWLPVPPPEVLGAGSSLEGLDQEKLDLLYARATPQPFASYEQPLPGPVEPAAGVELVLIACADFQQLLSAGIPMLAHLNEEPWRRLDLATGHWPMFSAPRELAVALDQVVTRP
ncbi:alpha/beta fold hydrolase [Streptomyces sp. NPDC000594]|uniref:alpha/beta fold hydrolase n=1 Tax=Streptomyces sp. NPDC000594 TaxID=3154261 RepID=UPI0033223A01